MHQKIMESRVELKVDGMTCQACVRSVTMKLSAVPGVSSAAVDLPAGRAVVQLDETRVHVEDLLVDPSPGHSQAAQRLIEPAHLGEVKSTMKRVEEIDFPIGGMTCASCARIIEGQLASTPGVARASVNFATRVASVRYDPARVGLDNLVAAVEDIGYGVPAGPQELAEQAEAADLRDCIRATGFRAGNDGALAAAANAAHCARARLLCISVLP